MRAPPLDLRLVPAALAVWATCLAAVRVPPRAAATCAGVLALAALAVAAVAARGARDGEEPGRDRGVTAATGILRTLSKHASGGPRASSSPYPRGPSGLRRAGGHAVLVLVVSAAALASTAAQGAVRDAGLLAAVTAEHAVVRVTGTVRSAVTPVRGGPSWSAEGDRFRVVLVVEHLSGRGRSGPAAAPVLVLAGSTWRDVPYGSRVRALGALERTGPGDAMAAMLVVRGPPRQVTAPGPVHRVVAGLRGGLLRASAGLPADQRGLVPGTAIGDTSRIPTDLDAAMRVAGLTHVTAVSGAHFAIVGAVVLALATVVGLPRSARGGVVAVAMTGFVLLVHPAPSVLRAAVMGAVGVLALVLGRPARAVPALAACVLVLLLIDPWLAGSIGFALSVVATAGIVLGTGPLADGMSPLLGERGARLVAVPLAAQCACGPVVALLAPGLTTYAVPANVLAAPAIVPATVLGVLATVVAPWWDWGAELLVQGSGWATWWVAGTARFFAGLPGARLPWPEPPAGPLLLGVVTLGAVVGIARRRPRPVGAACPSVAGCAACHPLRAAPPATTVPPGDRRPGRRWSGTRPRPLPWSWSAGPSASSPSGPSPASSGRSGRRSPTRRSRVSRGPPTPRGRSGW